MDKSRRSNQLGHDAVTNDEETIPLSSPSPSMSDDLSSKLKQQKQRESVDEDDGLPPMVFSCLEIVCIIFSIFSYVFDLGMDIVVAMFHYFSHSHLEFWLTLVFIILPMLTTTFFSLKWYIEDSKEEAFKVSPIKWFLRILFLILQLGPILRYITSLSHGIKSKMSKSRREKKQNYAMMVQNDADASLLQIFQAFLEDAPQLILQISILADPNLKQKSILIQRLALVSSLLGISWTLVAQHRALRLAIPRCAKMTWPGTFLQFAWRLFTVAARMMALGLFASVHPIAFAILFVLRWAIMTAWIVSMKTTFCQPPSRWQEFVYNAVLGVVFLFCYFNPKDTPTRWRYLIYYTYTFIENTALIAIWYKYCDSCSSYNLPILCAQICSFWIGLAFMVVYYLYLHPTGKIRIWRWKQHDEEEEEEEREMTDTATYKEAGCYTITLTLKSHHPDLTSQI